MKNLIDAIEKNGILIGSRAWGGYNDHSDYDYVFDIPTLNHLITFFSKHQLIYSKSGHSASGGGLDRFTMFNEENIKITLLGVDYNLIGYKVADILKIEKLNEAMLALNCTDIGTRCKNNKQIRIMVVETFLNVLFEQNEYPDNTTNNRNNNNEDIELDISGVFN